MKTTAEKIIDLRMNKGLLQKDLAEQAGTTVRSISSYETGKSKPRGLNLRKLCSVLGVSEAYLMNDEIEDPSYGLEEAPYVDAARAAYGSKGAQDVESLLTQTQALFAGGDLPQEDKDLFFQAVTEAYFANKARASETFTRNDLKKG